MVQMEITRRFSHYNIGDMIAVDFYAGRELEAKRLARPLHLLVPPRAAAAAGPDDPSTSGPVRQPGAVVRK